MLKALRYLKPFWLSVIAIIALVYGQVQLELALPDYMSNIVTYGIQYGGIDKATPEVLTSSTFERMLYFVSPEDRDTLREYYTYDRINETYRLNSRETDLSDITSKPFLIVSSLNNEEMQKQLNITDIDSFYSSLSNDPSLVTSIMETMDKQLENYTEENIKSLEIIGLRQEYQLAGIDTEAMQNSYIFNTGIRMLGLALLGSLCAIGSSYLASRTATGAARSMRQDVFEKVESFSSEEFSHFSTASLITRTTNDIQQVQQVLTMLLRIVLFAPMMGLTSLFKVMRYPEMVSILGWVIGMIVILLLAQFFITLPKFKIIQSLVDRLNLVIREQLSGMLVIRAFNNQKFEENRFDEVNTDITNVTRFVNRAMAVIGPVMQFLMNCTSILIIWFGAKQVDLGIMQVGDIMAFLQYSIHVLMSFMIVAMIFVMIPRSSVSARRVFEVLETKPSITDPLEPKQLPTKRETLYFDHVDFHYPDAQNNVLEDITFDAKPGETVAIIGSTGSGKSTLVNLIPRFFDVTGGSIRIGDVNIKDVRMKDLRDEIGYVPQKATLFSGTVESNLKYADENATQDKIDEALTVSQSKEFVEKMPDGINEPIAQGGTNVSGGQKQRLSIARALVKDANIFIFDDTFSALDYKTDALLREALNKLIKKTQATVLIVAQRISSIKHADKILVLDKGRIVGMGTHDELLESCGVYQEIANSQLSGEELGK